MGSKERIEREKGRRREDIIRAAEKYFVKKGIAGSTMDEIARECELSKGTLYLYFKSKEQLFYTIINKAFSELLEKMKITTEKSISPLERLRLSGEAYFKFYDLHPDLFHILSMFSKADCPGGETDEEMAGILEKNARIWELSTSIIRDGINDGTFRKDTDPVEIAISLFALSRAFIEMIDMQKRHSAYLKDEVNQIFSNLNLWEILQRNARRIIFSIMTNPPADPNLTKGSHS